MIFGRDFIKEMPKDLEPFVGKTFICRQGGYIFLTELERQPWLISVEEQYAFWGKDDIIYYFDEVDEARIVLLE